MSDADVTVVKKQTLIPFTSGELNALRFLVEYAQEQYHNNGVLQCNMTEATLDRLENKLKGCG